ncbi:hypothetical protein RJ639_043043 [Escallonia herrerae]|uniref:Uncharacterized protein n=1 Tax=Escallonia herrerae TaxID=1293975 RepID=A0AA89B510_9ASTE|nr:hypothetical protein RJ639_043043 [Escallonia herrerae]
MVTTQQILVLDPRVSGLGMMMIQEIGVQEGPLVGPDWRPKRSASLCISLGVKLGNDTDLSDVATNCCETLVAGAVSPAVRDHATAYALPSPGNGSMLRIWDRTVFPSSGGSMNPVRTLGPAVAAGNYKAIWIYLVAPTLGALAGAAIYTSVKLTGDEGDPPRQARSFRR